MEDSDKKIPEKEEPMEVETEISATAPELNSTSNIESTQVSLPPLDLSSIAVQFAHSITLFTQNLEPQDADRFYQRFRDEMIACNDGTNLFQPDIKPLCTTESQTTLSDAVSSMPAISSLDPDVITKTKVEMKELGCQTENYDIAQKVDNVARDGTVAQPHEDNSNFGSSNKTTFQTENRDLFSSSTTISSTPGHFSQPMPISSPKQSYSDACKRSRHRSVSPQSRFDKYYPPLKPYETPQPSIFQAPVKSAPVAHVNTNANAWLQNSPSDAKPHFSHPNKKTLNILILGQTGVGKSTWINAFANYLHYSTLEEAITAQAPLCIIPTKFSMFDNNYQRHEILFGTDPNEVFSDQGQSATQSAKTYLLEGVDSDIYLIDTPGIGDTRGKEEDDLNLKKILRTIAPFKELHAICFLFKANDARLTPSFKYCIGRLLGNLSKSTLKNACFVFTNSRGTFYKPGDTMGPLNTYFNELQRSQNLAVQIKDANTFCLDNEAFRFICAYFSQAVQFSPEEIKSFSDSWAHSSKEIQRLVDYAGRLRPHNVADTLSVNDTRTWILQLVKPIIEITNIIDENIRKHEHRVRELKMVGYDIEELQKRAALPIVTLKSFKLPSPRTVCENCATYEEIDNQIVPIYKQVCHDNCHLNDINPELHPDPGLRQCAAFTRKNDYCNKCPCHWTFHNRLICETRVVTHYDQQRALQAELASTTDLHKLKKQMIRNSRHIIDGYRQELEFILHAMAKFSIFLAHNGISHTDDVFEKHLENLLEREERMIRRVPQYSDEKYDHLTELLCFYRDIQHSNSNSKFTLEEITDIKQKLFALPLTGAKIAEVFDIHVSADESDYVETVTRVKTKNVIQRGFEYLKKKITSFF